MQPLQRKLILKDKLDSDLLLFKVKLKFEIEAGFPIETRITEELIKELDRQILQLEDQISHHSSFAQIAQHYLKIIS